MLTSRSQPVCTPPPSPKRKPVPPTPTRTPVGYADDVRMNTAKNLTLKDIKMHTARNGLSSGLPVMDNNTLHDVRMETARGGTTIKSGFQLWEMELLESPEVKRKATVAQLCG
jgi:cell cycle protein kinase DBF2